MNSDKMISIHINADASFKENKEAVKSLVKLCELAYKNMTTKPTHGGSRPNAGRNPDNYEKSRVVIPKALKPTVKRLCEEWKLNQKP